MKDNFFGMGMASKRKKNMNSEGPVKIVGINHGVCLHHFLLMDGWKKEQFTVRPKSHFRPSTKQINYQISKH